MLPFNLESAVGSQKSVQVLGAPAKIKKCRITTEVTTNFFISPCTPISSTLVLRPTAVSRFNDYSIIWGVQKDIHPWSAKLTYFPSPIIR